MTKRIAFLGLVVLLAGCADWPELPDGEHVEGGVGWPTLVPLGSIMPGPVDTVAHNAEMTRLAERAAALRVRAARLRDL